jgi:hypothetical protein
MAADPATVSVTIEDKQESNAKVGQALQLLQLQNCGLMNDQNTIDY